MSRSVATTISAGQKLLLQTLIPPTPQRFVGRCPCRASSCVRPQRRQGGSFHHGRGRALSTNGAWTWRSFSPSPWMRGIVLAHVHGGRRVALTKGRIFRWGGINEPPKALTQENRMKGSWKEGPGFEKNQLGVDLDYSQSPTS
jgi:hypothetical protein